MADARMKDSGNGINRREFLTRCTALGALLSACPAAALEKMRIDAVHADTPDWAAEDPWKTIAEVQQHLFPATRDAPGASDFRALVYLHNTLENPAADAADREFVVDGVGWLNDLTQERFQQPFSLLDTEQRELVLRQIEQSRAGRNWLSLLLTYLMEALLTAPVYGGNPDGIGWKWLEHQPGYPLPPADKTWYRLAEL